MLHASCSESVKNRLGCSSSILIMCVLMLSRQNKCIQPSMTFKILFRGLSKLHVFLMMLTNITMGAPATGRFALDMPMTDKVTVMTPCYHFHCNSWNMLQNCLIRVANLFFSEITPTRSHFPHFLLLFWLVFLFQ